MPARSSRRHWVRMSSGRQPLSMKARAWPSPVSTPMVMPSYPASPRAASSLSVLSAVSVTLAKQPMVSTSGRYRRIRPAISVRRPGRKTKGLAPVRKTRRTLSPARFRASLASARSDSMSSRGDMR